MKIRYDWVSDKVWPYIRDKEGYKSIATLNAL